MFSTVSDSQYNSSILSILLLSRRCWFAFPPTVYKTLFYPCPFQRLSAVVYFSMPTLKTVESIFLVWWVFPWWVVWRVSKYFPKCGLSLFPLVSYFLVCHPMSDCNFFCLCYLGDTKNLCQDFFIWLFVFVCLFFFEKCLFRSFAYFKLIVISLSEKNCSKIIKLWNSLYLITLLG